ncbi:M28 family peptidase [Synechococcus sp. CBW1006]|nr:M28 family peptidase [Synechococcus sp. CBW1006]
MHSPLSRISPDPSRRKGLQQRLRIHLEQLVRPRHLHWDPLGLMAVRSYLLEQFNRLGAVEQQSFEEGAGEGINVILRLPGQEAQLAPLLVAAHYDGPISSPGADDNASGLAALLELAGRWAAIPPRRPVWIVAFDQEEWGMLGSRALARQLKASGQPLQLMLSLEMLGYTAARQSYPLAPMRRLYGDRGDFIALVANIAATSLLPGLASGMGAHVRTRVLPVPFHGRLLPDVRLSDHSPFWDAGYNAVMVTDTSFLRNPHYHQPSDTIDTLDLPFLAAVTDGLDAALREL